MAKPRKPRQLLPSPRTRGQAHGEGSAATGPRRLEPKPPAIRRVCLFCGSRLGERPVYAQAARELGAALSAHGLDLVFGGAAHGLMGTVADAMLAQGRAIIGVIPRGLARQEFAHPRLSQQHLVDSMHERKALMEQLSDAVVALPGGFGTLDELFEALTWAQLGIHRKPLALLNVDGYFAPLLEWIRRAVAEGFVPHEAGALLIVESDAEALVRRLLDQPPPPFPVRWISTVRR